MMGCNSPNLILNQVSSMLPKIQSVPHIQSSQTQLDINSLLLQTLFKQTMSFGANNSRGTSVNNTLTHLLAMLNGGTIL